NRIRQSHLHAIVGTSRLRQDHACASHCPPNKIRIRPLQRRHLRHQGNQGGHGRRRAQIPLRLPNDCLRRRSPSLQQGPARRLPPSRRSRPHPVHRRHHRKSFLRSHLPASLPHQGLRSRSSQHTTNRRSPQTRPRRQRTRPRQGNRLRLRGRLVPH